MGATLPALASSADRLEALQAEVEAERERRNRMIVELVDSGTARKQVCAAARVSPKSVCIFLAEAG